MCSVESYFFKRDVSFFDTENPLNGGTCRFKESHGHHIVRLQEVQLNSLYAQQECALGRKKGGMSHALQVSGIAQPVQAKSSFNFWLSRKTCSNKQQYHLTV